MQKNKWFIPDDLTLKNEDRKKRKYKYKTNINDIKNSSVIKVHR